MKEEMKEKIIEDSFPFTYSQIAEQANIFGSEGDHNSRVVANLLLTLREALKYLPKENAEKVRKIIKNM